LESAEWQEVHWDLTEQIVLQDIPANLVPV